MAALVSALSLAACGSRQAAAPVAEQAPAAKVDAPDFNADSAYAYIKAQTDFGPRVPGSTASAKCAGWLEQQLTARGAENVQVQKTRLTAYNGDSFEARNITASFNPTAEKRVLLLSHWDSRPWADQDPDPANHRKPIDGANDGASGVGVILEVARQIAAKAPGVGVDVLFTDAEDYGTHASEHSDNENAWCLGTQYWVEHPTLDLSRIDHAILLDMVGGKNARFLIEPYSIRSASSTVKKLWRTANNAGYAQFTDAIGTPVIDDHLYLISAGIPAVDIIEAAHPDTGSFNPTWHTMADNIDNIDKTTLKAVGQTLLDYLYGL